MGKKVWVTGCAGFIGSHVVDACLAEGWTVVGVDDMSNGHEEFLNKDIEFVKGDFAHDATLAVMATFKPEVVFHLAARPRVSWSVEHPLESHDHNVTRTAKLIEECRLTGVRRFVFSSSSSVYGGANVLPTPETEPKDPKSPYALQKSMIEDQLALYWSLYKFDSVCLRYFNVFGDRQLGGSPYATAVGSWFHAVVNGYPLRSDGDGEQTRDMCHVSNVAHANVLAAKDGGELGAVQINVGCNARVSNNQVLAWFRGRYPNVKIVNAPERLGDVKHTQASIDRAKKLLGYEPRVQFWEGLELTAKWTHDNKDLLKRLRSTNG